MPDINDFSTGRQCRIVILHPLAREGRLDLSIVTEFDAKPKFKDIKVDGLDGVNRAKFQPEGWDVTISLDRANAVADDFCGSLEAASYDSGNVVSAVLYQYITETDGSLTTYQFEGLALKMEDAGSWKADSAVKQKMMGHATRRRRIA